MIDVGRGNVLIVGGGIGGLTTAIALRNADYDVHVVELRPGLRSSVAGAGIIQPVNALRALEAIGCAQECLDAGFSSTAWGRVLDVEGNVIGEMPGATIPGSGLPPLNGLTRPQLHEILTRKAREAGAVIECGKTFTELADTPNGVDVRYSDGTREVVDIVVGADGVHSEVRAHVLGETAKPVYNGQFAFRCIIPREPEIDRIILQKGPSGTAGFVPLAQDLAYLFYSTSWDRDDRPHPDELGEVLRERLAPFGGLTGRVRDKHINDPSVIVVRPEEWLIAPPPWHEGRIVLIGDAVHAVTPQLGQGAAQAIEDGVVLAECLSGGNGLEEAFARYAERRYERCKLIVESSVQIGEWDVNPTEDVDHAGLTQRVLGRMVQPI